MHLYLLISRKTDYINVCMLYIYIDSILPPFSHTIRIDWLKHETRVSLPLFYIQFLFVLCISERCKKNSVFVFEEKAIFLGKQGGPKDYVCSEKIDFHNQFVLYF